MSTHHHRHHTPASPVTKPLTYAEIKGQEPFDWWKALENPPAEGSIMHNHLIELAAKWPTCACGNQCAAIPRFHNDPWHFDGAPQDDTLRELGARFFGDISVADWPAARQTLAAIERRSAQLIGGGE